MMHFHATYVIKKGKTLPRSRESLERYFLKIYDLFIRT
jgi:hypothetical protein